MCRRVLCRVASSTARDEAVTQASRERIVLCIPTGTFSRLPKRLMAFAASAAMMASSSACTITTISSAEHILKISSRAAGGGVDTAPVVAPIKSFKAGSLWRGTSLSSDAVVAVAPNSARV